MKLTKTSGKVAAVYAVFLGVFYIVIGVIECVEGFNAVFFMSESRILERIPAEFAPADFFGGLSAVVIGAAYLGVVGLWKAKFESLSFLLVGALMSTVFGVLYLLVFGANGFGAYLAGEEWEWTTDIARPEIWLFFASLPLGYFALNNTRGKTK